MVDTLEFFIPGRTPPSLNQWQRMSRWTISIHNHFWRRLVASYARASNGVPLEPTTEKMRVEIVLYVKRRGDPDNVLVKPLLDAIKHCGLIVDDSRKWVDLHPPPRQAKASESEQGVGTRVRIGRCG